LYYFFLDKFSNNFILDKFSNNCILDKFSYNFFLDKFNNFILDKFSNNFIQDKFSNNFEEVKVVDRRIIFQKMALEEVNCRMFYQLHLEFLEISLFHSVELLDT